MSQPFFTIIVPHHRTEPYLEQTLRSIQSQTFTNFECLVVNDGSPGVDLDRFEIGQDPDYSPSVDVRSLPKEKQTQAIFDGVVGNDPRFTLLSKTQGGTASARNFAFQHMKGDWAVCVDADDWILPTHLEILHQNIEDNSSRKYPIICFLGLKFYNTGQDLNVKYQKKLTLANLLYAPALIEWNYAMNAEIIRKYNLKNEELLGPGPERENVIIKHGYDDLAFGWMYVDAVQKEVGKNNLFFKNTEQKTYMYRDLNSFKKNQLKGGNAMFTYAKYLSPFASKSSDLSVKFAALLFPIYTSCFEHPNFFKREILKRAVGFLLKFFTHFYF